MMGWASSALLAIALLLVSPIAVPARQLQQGSTFDIPQAGAVAQEPGSRAAAAGAAVVQIASGAAAGTPFLAPGRCDSCCPAQPVAAPADPAVEAAEALDVRTGPLTPGAVRVAGTAASPITSVTCYLDANSNVADVVFGKLDGTTVGSCNTPAAVPVNGRVRTLDFSDSWIVQVQLGKLDASGTVAWLGFRTDSADMRTCGNVRPSSATATISKWTGSLSSLSRIALSALTPTCSTAAPKTLTGLSGVTFGASLPARVPLQTGVPTYCTPVFTWPDADVSFLDGLTCSGWTSSTAGKAAAAPAASPSCPPSGNPKAWTPAITVQQLPVTRPPKWTYRPLSSALSSNVVITRRTAGDYLVATVRHSPIPGVTAAMMYWWFNGNIDGDMVLGGQTFPRYQVWHPTNHISQSTIIPGPTKGSAQGSYWSIVELLTSHNNPNGYVKGSAAGSWNNEFPTFLNVKVQALSATGLELRVTQGGAVPMRLVHTWADTGSGLDLTSTLYVGVQPPLDNPLSSTMNAVVFKIFGGDCTELAANAWLTHAVEEMGNLQFFLPQLYGSVTGR